MQVTGVKEIVDPLSAIVESLTRVVIASVGIHVSENNAAAALTYLTLRNLVVMMREGQINSARMYVHAFAKDCTSHNAALDVPAWSPRTPS